MVSISVPILDRKICGCCKESKSISEFGMHKCSRDGLRAYCKPCWNSYKHKWRLANREKHDQHARRKRERDQDWKSRDPLQFNIKQRIYRLRREYGLTEEQFQAMIVENEGRCRCCGKVPGPEGWGIDHDHKTGEIRGLVCKSCNAGIGLLGDTLERVQLAVDYLSGFRHACTT